MTDYVAGQEIPVNPLDVRVHADIGISDWDGSNAAALWAEPVPVMPPVRDYVIAQRQIAKARVESDPVLKSLATTWPELEAASSPIRARRAAERDTEQWERTPIDLRKARDERAAFEIRQAVAPKLEAKLKALTELEQTVRAELDDPPTWRPTVEDMAAVVDLRQSLQLLTTDYAVPILLRQLVLDPAQRGKGLGKASALLPVLRSMYETNAPTGFAPNGDPRPRGYHTYEVLDVITQAEAVRRDAAYYAAYQKLRAIEVARYKLGVLASDYAQGVGLVGGTPRWFAEFGVPQPPAPERNGPYLGELSR